MPYPKVGKVTTKQKKAIQENYLVNDVSMALWTKAISLDRLDLDKLGIDVVISPEELASKEIIRLLRRSAFSNAFDFELLKLQKI